MMVEHESIGKSNIIDIDFLYFFLLAEVEVDSFVFLLTLRARTLALTLSFFVCLDKFDAAGRSVLVLVDLQVLGHFSLSLQLPNLVGQVFQYNVALLVLELSQTAHHQITNPNPYFLFHLASDVADSLHLVEASHQHSAVTQHLEGEAVLETFVVFLCEKFSLGRTRMLSSFIVLTSSTFVFGHCKRN